MSGVTPRVFCVLFECGEGDGQTPASQAEKILGLQVILLFQLRYSRRITWRCRRLLKNLLWTDFYRQWNEESENVL